MSGTVPPDPTAPDISGVPEMDSDPDMLRALERVDADLAALRDAPAPPIPDDVAARLDAALRKARPTGKRTQHVGRWIIAAAAAVALFAGVTGIAALREEPSAPAAVAVPDLGAAFDPDAGTTPGPAGPRAARRDRRCRSTDRSGRVVAVPARGQ